MQQSVQNSSIQFTPEMIAAEPVLAKPKAAPTISLGSLAPAPALNSATNTVPTTFEAAHHAGNASQKIETLLTGIQENQDLMLKELKKKNRYLAWKTFFSAIRLIIYIGILYVSYLGMIHFWQKIESGELQKQIMSQFNFEEMVSRSVTASAGNIDVGSLVHQLSEKSVQTQSGIEKNTAEKARKGPKPAAPKSAVADVLKGLEAQGIDPSSLISNFNR